MAKYINCVKCDDGKTYCWDDQLRQIVRLPDGVPTPIALKDAPDEAIKALLHKLEIKTRFEE